MTLRVPDECYSRHASLNVPLVVVACNSYLCSTVSHLAHSISCLSQYSLVIVILCMAVCVGSSLSYILNLVTAIYWECFFHVYVLCRCKYFRTIFFKARNNQKNQKFESSKWIFMVEFPVYSYDISRHTDNLTLSNNQPVNIYCPRYHIKGYYKQYFKNIIDHLLINRAVFQLF